MTPYCQSMQSKVEVMVYNVKWTSSTAYLAQRIEDALNEGWRLIAFSDSGNAYTCIFEREKTE